MYRRALFSRSRLRRARDILDCVARGFDDATVGMALIAPVGLRVVRANRAMCELLGRHVEEVVGHSILDFTEASDIERKVGQRAAICTGAEHGPLLSRYLRRDGSVVETMLTAGVIDLGRNERYRPV